MVIYKDPGGADTTWLENAGNKIKGKSSDGRSVKYEYNAKKQLIKEISVDKDEKIVITYTYNNAGQIISSSRTVDGYTSTETYTYNKIGLLSTKTETLGSGAKSVTKYGYKFY